MDVLVISDSKSGRSLVTRVLTNLGHRVVDAGTAGVGTQLASRSWQADVAVAALVAAQPTRLRFGAVGVELGIALGRGVPILLVAKPGLSVPFLYGIPRVDYADDEVLLAAQLELLLSGVSAGARREVFQRPKSPTSMPLEPPPSKDLGRARSFEREIGSLLKSHAGEDVVIYEGAALPDDVSEVDFAVLFPEEGSDLRVVLVEVKSGARTKDPSASRRILIESARKLSERVRVSRSGLGLLVYDGEAINLPTTPMTVALSLRQLESRLALEPFDQVLRRARNEAIHAL
ncbi:hypothetical protein [Cellulomonas humilata]|uniref:Restriction endonuclease type IV Mrr domain-containing protein n=1 Tax=Cellulomonas humilata TaxID=144055 RepID=A0ABU0EL14_9CELL|nr:hypothetical protein [Cellulomonas humilata]MDQ0375978.1 hypothetical protein [Cellulomonas humilata]